MSPGSQEHARRRRRKRIARAGDGIECGCCLADLFVMTALLGSAVVWRRTRRGRR